jgi:RsiG-like
VTLAWASVRKCSPTVALHRESNYAQRVEALPDLGSLSDTQLRALIPDLQAQERRESYERKILHGKIDILQAELVRRAGEGPPGGIGGVREPRRPSPTGGEAAESRDP